MKKRNANLDVLRCFSMFLVVLVHSYQFGEYWHASWGLDFLYLLLIRWQVDAFLALSGWFGMKFSLKKFGKLWGLVAFYSVISIVVGRLVMGVATPIKIDGGWFGNAYLCLMLIVPFLNAGIEGLVAKGSKVAWMAWLGFAAMITINWISPTAYFGISAWDIHSHSLVQMVFIYFTVRLFKLTGIIKHVRLWHVLVTMGIFVIGCLVLGTWRTDYIAPYVVAMAVAMLVLFERFLKFPECVGRLCVWMAPSMFGVYLLHGLSFGKTFLRAPAHYLAGRGVPPALVIFLSAVACFAICFVFDLARRYSLHGIIAICKRK